MFIPVSWRQLFRRILFLKPPTCAICDKPLGDNPGTLKYRAMVDEETQQTQIFSMKLCSECADDLEIRRNQNV